MDDLTKELWQGTAERGRQPEPVDLPPLLLVEPTLRVADKSGWREFLGSRKFGLMLALACILGLLGIASANPFASPSVSEHVAETWAVGDLHPNAVRLSPRILTRRSTDALSSA